RSYHCNNPTHHAVSVLEEINKMLQATVLPRYWQKPLLGLLLATLACITVFWETWHSITDIWYRSETFAHGYLVAPISLWLIWTRRAQYRPLQPIADPLGLLAMAGCGAVWLTADLIDVLVVQQWAVVGILICSIWTILGNRVTRNMLFPILFLLLMVPFGEDFVPFLMEYTATFVVGMLRLTGISVYREGLHFTLTSGNWSVVDACSGIRYLIASITLGLVYAYLNYSSYIKRALFILVSILTPILANGLRAYMIVMIGHLSDMKLATGVDHIIYGWLFFGLVMLLVFYAGSFWQDPPMPIPVASTSPSAEAVYPHFWLLMSAILLCLTIWPISSKWMTSHQSGHLEIPERLTQPPISPWRPTGAPNWGWEPQFQGVAAHAQSFLGNGETVAGIYVANFDNGSQGGELVNSQNVLVPQNDKIWRILATRKTPVHWPGGKPVEVDESVLNGKRQDLDLLVLRWYRIGSQNTANSYYAKWLQLLKRLSGDASPELLIVLYTETSQGEHQQARENLQKLAEACCG
ncbi:MAG: exosortase A, partial [Methylococcaceae bacterium]|nr:exosortase A [Methylococcaceae bacterium]